MLSVDDPRIEPLREQRRSAVVTDLCGCGCASINLRSTANTPDRRRSADSPFRPTRIRPLPPMHPRWRTAALLLFLDEGWLSLLEICWLETPPPEFPPPTAFRGPEVTCERDAAARAALDRDWPDGGQGRLRSAWRRFGASLIDGLRVTLSVAD